MWIDWKNGSKNVDQQNSERRSKNKNKNKKTNALELWWKLSDENV